MPLMSQQQEISDFKEFQLIKEINPVLQFQLVSACFCQERLSPVFGAEFISRSLDKYNSFSLSHFVTLNVDLLQHDKLLLYFSTSSPAPEIWKSAEVTPVQCCVCQWHLFSEFPITVFPIWSLVLRPSLAMHILILCDRQKQAVFSCIPEIKISPAVHKQRSPKFVSVVWLRHSTLQCGYSVCMKSLHLQAVWWGRTECCLHLSA